jgi:hypothetical protein
MSFNFVRFYSSIETKLFYFISFQCNSITINVHDFVVVTKCYMSFAGMAPQGHFLKWNQDADPLPYKKKPRLLNREESSV